jgi:hypothetical protein
MNEKHLIFIYNSDSDFFSTLSDFAHKVLSPSTYQCQLCALTYGNFSMKNEWKSFIENLPVKVVFLYKDEFRKRYKIEAALPAIYIYDNRLEEFLSKESIEQCKSLQELKQLIAFKIKEHDQHHHTNI